jgi:hypothetical protein
LATTKPRPAATVPPAGATLGVAQGSARTPHSRGPRLQYHYFHDHRGPNNSRPARAQPHPVEPNWVQTYLVRRPVGNRISVASSI